MENEKVGVVSEWGRVDGFLSREVVSMPLFDNRGQPRDFKLEVHYS